MKKRAQGKEAGTTNIRMVPLKEIELGEQMSRKVTKKSPGIEGLAASIRSTGGVLSPVIVRPAKNRYELLAGARRLVASDVAGFNSIKAEIMEADDARARHITVTENLQREDLTPLEEAQGLRMLLDQGKDRKEVAARLGRSVYWVIRRAKLADLTPEWQEVLAGRKPTKLMDQGQHLYPETFERWTVGHMELIARYSPETQNEILREILDDTIYADEMTLDNLDRELSNRVQRLRKAPWKLDDDSLVPEKGACISCPERSSNSPGLFDDDMDPKKIEANDRCLNVRCWEQKMEQYLDRRTAELREKHEDLVKVSSIWNPRAEGVVGRGDYDEVKKKDKGARPVLMVDGPARGQLKWIKFRTKGGEQNARERDSKGKLKPLSKKERYEKLNARRNAYVVKTVREILQDTKDERNRPGFCIPLRPEKRVLAMAALTATFGIRPVYEHRRYDSLDTDKKWEQFKKLMESTRQDVVAALWERMRNTLQERLAFWDTSGAAAKIDEARRICEVLDLPFELLEEEAEKKIPVPKTWAKLDLEAKKKGSMTRQKSRK